jgi:hypothetical protein
MTRNAPARSAGATKATGPRRTEPRAKCECAQRAAARAGPCSHCRRAGRVGVQAQLAFGASGDRYEREADRAANRIARGGRVARSREGYPTPLQTHAVRGIAAPAETIDAALATPGQVLDRPTRAFYESRLAHDFSNVRVHAGPAAAAAAKALDARAFTLGRHVFFADGQFRPDAPRGRHLLAHELAHVVQQSALRASDVNHAAWAPVQRQSWLETLQSGAASLVPESVWSALDVDPAAVAAMAPDPAAAIALLKRLRDAPVLGPMLMRALPTSEGVETLLGLDAGTLDRVFAVLADPGPHLEALRGELQPLVEQVPAYAAAEAEARLGWLRDRGEPFARVMDAMGHQLAQLPAQWWPIAVEILRSQFMLWDWSAQSAALKDAAAKRTAGEFDDDYEYWLHVAQTLSDGLDRILGAVGMAAFVVGLAGGGTAGGAAGGTGAGVVGGAVTLGTGAAPSAAVGGTAGGAAGGGIGGGLGGLAYELLGGVSLVGAVGTEVGLLGDAVKDLSLEEQSAEREQADYEQVAASLIGLAMMAAFAVLGSVGARIARNTKGALLGAARKAAAKLDAPAPSLAAAEAAASLPAVARRAPRDVTRTDVAEAARASPAEIESSVARSAHLENDQLAPEQIAKEVAHVDRHPELVEGEAPHRRAEVGEHEIVEQPGGGCVRRSDPPARLTPCPLPLRSDAPPDAASVLGRARLVRNAALGLLEDPHVAAQAERIARERAAGTDADVSGAVPGAVREELTRAVVPPEGEWQRSRLAGVRVTEERGGGGDAARRRNAFVKLMGSGGAYHDVVRAVSAPSLTLDPATEVRVMEHLRSIENVAHRDAFAGAVARALWLSDPELAATMRGILTSRRGPDVGRGRSRRAIANQLVKATYLLFMRESVRDPSNLVHAMMMLDLVESGRLGFAQALDLRSRFKWEGGQEFKGLASGRRTLEKSGVGARKYERVYSLPLPKTPSERKASATFLPLTGRIEGEKGTGRVITGRGHGGALPSSMLGASEAAANVERLLAGVPEPERAQPRAKGSSSTQVERDVLDYLLRGDDLTRNWLEHVAKVSVDDPHAVTAAIEQGLRRLYGVVR